MRRIFMGSVHETMATETEVIQILNATFPVPTMNDVNALVEHLREYDIEAARVKKQDAKVRVMEKLEGEFFDSLTEAQAIKAAVFMAKLHHALDSFRSITFFRPVREFSDMRETIIWGDMNTSNILWRDGEPVGMVDYDTVMKGDRWYDVAVACVRWPQAFDCRIAERIVSAYAKEYPLDGRDPYGECRRLVLILMKNFLNAYMGNGYLSQPKTYLEFRLKGFLRTYEILCEKIEGRYL